MSRTTCLFILALAACDLAAPGEGGEPEPQGPAPAAIAGYPESVGACLGEPAAPTRLLVTTTDFATGGVSVVDLQTREVRADVAVGSTDAKPFWLGDAALVLHRYGLDALDLLDPAEGFALLAQRAITVSGVVSANPQSVVAGPDGVAYVPLFGAPEVQVWDLSDPADPRRTGRIDLRALADADGDPEASEALLCGGVLFVVVDLVDQAQSFAPTRPQAAVAVIDVASGAVHDLDPGAPGVQPLSLRGQWARQWRLDPSDPSGRTALVLTTGVERVDLSRGTSSWAVAPERLAAAGISDFRLPQAFDLGPGGDHVLLAAYRADYSEVALFRAALDRDEPLVEIAAGLQSVEQTLEVVGDTLWFGDRTPGASGLRAWDLREDPPAPLPGTPLPLGLAPYAAAPIP